MIWFESILRCVVAFTLVPFLQLGATSLAADPSAVNLRQLDTEREELQLKLEQARRERNRMYRRVSLVETQLKLLLLDYDDPRTKLGAAVAMNNVSHEHLVEILYAMTLARRATEEEEQQCLTHMAKHEGEQKRAVQDILWALCNTREFVDRIDN